MRRGFHRWKGDEKLYTMGIMGRDERDIERKLEDERGRTATITELFNVSTPYLCNGIQVNRYNIRQPMGMMGHQQLIQITRPQYPDKKWKVQIMWNISL